MPTDREMREHMRELVRLGAETLLVEYHGDQAAEREILAARDDLLIWIDAYPMEEAS